LAPSYRAFVRIVDEVVIADRLTGPAREVADQHLEQIRRAVATVVWPPGAEGGTVAAMVELQGWLSAALAEAPLYRKVDPAKSAPLS
jgi:hypothetical protein